MKTILECNLFLSSWKGLNENELSQIRAFLGCIGLSETQSQKFPPTQNLPTDFLIWFKGEYDPVRYDRIYYTDGESNAVGVVRNVNRRTGEILLYCAYNYTTRILMLDNPTCNLGYRMRLCTETEYKRLKRELNKVGLVWKDKLHRLEPTITKAGEGEIYWYIDDKLMIVADKERKGKASHLRYIAGNYFTDYGKALEICDKIREVLKSALYKSGVEEEENDGYLLNKC